MDKASASGAEDCGFKSHLGREEAAGFKRKNFCGVQSVVKGLSAQFHEDHKQYGSVPFCGRSTAELSGPIQDNMVNSTACDQTERILIAGSGI